jgi:hypothetical protein
MKRSAAARRKARPDRGSGAARKAAPKAAAAAAAAAEAEAAVAAEDAGSADSCATAACPGDAAAALECKDGEDPEAYALRMQERRHATVVLGVAFPRTPTPCCLVPVPAPAPVPATPVDAGSDESDLGMWQPAGTAASAAMLAQGLAAAPPPLAVPSSLAAPPSLAAPLAALAPAAVAAGAACAGASGCSRARPASAAPSRARAKKKPRRAPAAAAPAPPAPPAAPEIVSRTLFGSDATGVREACTSWLAGLHMVAPSVSAAGPTVLTWNGALAVPPLPAAAAHKPPALIVPQLAAAFALPCASPVLGTEGTGALCALKALTAQPGPVCAPPCAPACPPLLMPACASAAPALVAAPALMPGLVPVPVPVPVPVRAPSPVFAPLPAPAPAALPAAPAAAAPAATAPTAPAGAACSETADEALCLLSQAEVDALDASFQPPLTPLGCCDPGALFPQAACGAGAAGDAAYSDIWNDQHAPDAALWGRGWEGMLTRAPMAM